MEKGNEERKMTLSEALNTGRMLANHFQHFKLLHEYVQYIGRQQALEGEHSNRLTNIQAETEKAEAKLTTTKKSVEAEIQKLDAKKTEAESSTEEALKVHASEMKRLSHEREEAEKTLKNVTKRLEGIKEKLE